MRVREVSISVAISNRNYARCAFSSEYAILVDLQDVADGGEGLFTGSDTPDGIAVDGSGVGVRAEECGCELVG